jgi:GT2 family glycosyltransferase
LLKKSDNPLFSIIIPTHNGGDTFRDNLQVLLAQISEMPENSLEIIIIDSASDPAFSLEGLEGPIELISSTTDLGRAAARNRGIDISRGERILFLDDDIEPGVDFLLHHVKAAQLYPKETILGQVTMENPRCMDMAWDTSAYFPELKDGEKYNFIKFITANLSVPGDEIRKSGGFDTSFTGWGYEDLELGWRLEKNAGIALRYYKEAVGIHRHQRSLEHYLQNFEEKGVNALRLYLLHPGIKDEIKLEVEAVVDHFSEVDFFPGKNILTDLQTSCLELEAMNTWRENEPFRDMLREFYRNLSTKTERLSIRKAVQQVIVPLAVVIIAKQGIEQVLSTMGSIISSNYPLEEIRIIIYDPLQLPEVADFFRDYDPPVKLRLFQGKEQELQQFFRSGEIKDEIILFIDDSLRVTRSWLLESALAHRAGGEKLLGVVLPNTPLGRWVSRNRFMLNEFSLQTKNINVSFSRQAFLEKEESKVKIENVEGMVALRAVPILLSQSLIDMGRLKKVCNTHRGTQPKKFGLKAFLSLFKYFTHMGRYSKKGYSLVDSLLFPLFDKIHHFEK